MYHFCFFLLISYIVHSFTCVDSLPVHEAVLPLPYHFRQTDPAHQAEWTGSLRRRGSLKRSLSLRYWYVHMSSNERHTHTCILSMYLLTYICVYMYFLPLIFRRKRTVREGELPRDGLKRTGSFGNKKELILRRTEKRLPPSLSLSLGLSLSACYFCSLQLILSYFPIITEL